jgi:BirA family biotin operon repressor/biotin-[acetyl-CoA-carboxylase] ligase
LENFSAIAAALPDPFRLLVKESVGSTNDELRKLAESGMPEGLIVLAQKQTEGRGRRGAAWFSPPGESLAFSVLLRPSEPKALWPRLSLAMGLAVAEALEEYVPLVGVKWPNDVWINGRKIAGILVESGRDFVIVGIGLNVNSMSFPAEVTDTATSLALETGSPVDRGEVLSSVIRHVAIRRHQIGTAFSDLIDAIRVRCVLSGKQVSLHTPTGLRIGNIEGITPQGELMFRSERGLEILMQADEVRILGDGR